MRNYIGSRLLKAVCVSVALCALITLATAQSTVTHESRDTAQRNSVQQPQQLKVTEYLLAAEKLAKAEALYKIRTGLYLFGLVFGLFVLWGMLKLRVGPALRDIAERRARNSFLQAVIFVPLLMLLIAVISSPVDIYEHHVSRAYGLSVQSWASWTGDWLKSEGITIAISIVAVFGLFRIIRKSPVRWWFYFWLITQPFIVLLIFVAPVILDPMFNTFEPLEKTQPQLVSAIQQVTARGGLNIPPDRMFEMKASEKVTTYNAYVTGLGATKRVVVWDNTSRDMTLPETLFVFGHEVGHYVLNHIYKGLAFFSATSLLGFWIGQKLVLGMLQRWGDGWHIRGVHDMAALPALMLVLALLTLAGEPVGNAFSRYQEHQADIYGLEVTHGLFPNNGEVAASAFQKLGENSYDYPWPNPALVFWSYSHPSIADRIQFSLRYDPWDTPSGPKYVK